MEAENAKIEGADRLTVSLGELSRLSPGPGQVYALRLDHRATMDQVQDIQRIWAMAMPDTKVIILDSSMHLMLIDDGEAKVEAWIKRGVRVVL